MANEIYDSTWWGNTIDTASSIGTSTEMIQGQFNLTKLGDEEVVNGDFATDSDWVLTSGATISNDKLNVNANAYDYFARQLNVSTIGKTYKVSVDVEIQSGRIILYLADTNAFEVIDTSGSYTFYIVADGTQIRFRAFDTGFNGSIDNVSVKQVRATTVEASKCLADAIHRIGIQDIQN